MSISKTFNVSDIYEFHSEDVDEDKHSRTSSSRERRNDENMINKLVKEYINHINRGKRENKITGGRRKNEITREDPKTHTVGKVWSEEYMDHGFTKSIKELDRCYTMLQELRSVIVGGALIHKNREGSKHEGRPWRCEVNGKYDLKKISTFLMERKENFYGSTKSNTTITSLEVKVKEKIMKAEVVEDHIEKIQDLQSYKQHDDNISTLSFGTTNKVGTLKTCEEIMGFNDDEDVKGFNCELKKDFKCVHNLNVRDLDYGRVKKNEGFRVDVKRKSIKDKVRREVFDVDEALDI
nr:transposon Ty3-I Gag-Pol polyprotein [Tanacetum cinerariifolium]